MRETTTCRRLRRRFNKARSNPERKRLHQRAKREGCGWAPRATRRFGDVESYGRSRTATLYVGRKRGLNKQNRTARCKRAYAGRKQIPIKAVDEAFIDIRAKQVGRENVGATRRKGAGWYQGQPEDALSYEVVFIPSAKEKDYKKFTKNMYKMGEKLANRLCQDSVIVVTDDGDIRSAAGAWCPTDKC